MYNVSILEDSSRYLVVIGSVFVGVHCQSVSLDVDKWWMHCSVGFCCPLVDRDSLRIRSILPELNTIHSNLIWPCDCSSTNLNFTQMLFLATSDQSHDNVVTLETVPQLRFRSPKPKKLQHTKLAFNWLFTVFSSRPNAMEHDNIHTLRTSLRIISNVTRFRWGKNND